MADEDDVRELSGGFLRLRGQLDPEAYEGRLRVPTTDQVDNLPRDINPRGYSKWPLSRFVQAAYDGDLELLGKMLDREDPIDGYHHDFTEHLLPEGYNALHAASMAGQLEAVEMLLKAGVDPHVRRCMPEGRDPKDGETAKQLADSYGWNDVAAVLKRAEEVHPRGLYKEFGRNNNAKLWPIDQPEGLDAEQERRAKKKYQTMVMSLPNKADRVFYGDLVYGVNFGRDARGKIIGSRQAMGNGADLALSDAMQTSVALLFPGPGSQHPKMMQGADQVPGGPAMLTIAERILGYDLQELCNQGDRAKLEEVTVAGPAVFVASLAALAKLKAQRAEVADHPGAVAGLDLGEFAALVAAGVFDFETGLSLVKTASEGIAEASKSSKQAMLSVAGLEEADLSALCDKASKTAGEVCQIAILLFPRGFTCCGGSQAIAELDRLAKESGALQTKELPSKGAVHTSLMAKAREQLLQALQGALPTMKPPKCDVYLTSSKKVYSAGSSPAALIEPLCDQLTSPIHWESSVRKMSTMGIESFYEVGPMGQLKAVMKRINPEAWAKMETIDVDN
eukprot:TRINITY_DN105448_c0_g1_i1.p1 TRINITY_DN105448_c0_g1~~TRINITY_DN105448_c0_g1_i1.p1  ORF type:complete len:564 (+),score=132.45 TRINITY_DN105448_c0_g1_i1:53-1744(+)